MHRIADWEETIFQAPVIATIQVVYLFNKHQKSIEAAIKSRYNSKQNKYINETTRERANERARNEWHRWHFEIGRRLGYVLFNPFLLVCYIKILFDSCEAICW